MEWSLVGLLGGMLPWVQKTNLTVIGKQYFKKGRAKKQQTYADYRKSLDPKNFTKLRLGCLPLFAGVEGSKLKKDVGIKLHL